MITVLVKRGFTDTWDSYLHDWGGASKHDFDIRTYQDLAGLQHLRAGPIIFSDIERLTDADRALASDVFRVVAKDRPDVPILNNPATTLRRYDLLTRLHRDGLNPFRVYRLTDTTTPQRFPVFLRYENDHTGATTGLLHNQAELDRAIVRTQIRQHDLRELLIVEFVDTSNRDGRYLKYGAFVVGSTIVARHAPSSTDWVVKFRDAIQTPDTADFELSYVRNNPHASLLHRLFNIGSVAFGRIDYAMLGDSLVTWEINTNPIIMTSARDTHPLSVQRQELFVSRFQAAFDAVQPEDLDPSPISLADVGEELRVAAKTRPQARASAIQRFGRKHKRWLEPAVRVVETASIPIERRRLDRWKRLNGI